MEESSLEEQVIEVVRQHKELYDTKHRNYMKTKLKSRIWSEIAKQIHLKDGDEVKNLWLKLRGSYRDARRRKLKYMKSGAPAGHIKPWRFQKQMSFLESFTSTGPHEENLNIESDEKQLSHQHRDRDSNLEAVGVTHETEQCSPNTEREDDIAAEDERIDLDQPSGTDDIASTSSAYFSGFTQPQKKKSKTDDVREIIKECMKKREQRMQERAKERKQLLQQHALTDDPLYTFFMSMYQLAKKMPANYQHKVRFDVFNAVSQTEAEIITVSLSPNSLRENVPYPLFPSSTSISAPQTPSYTNNNYYNM